MLAITDVLATIEADLAKREKATLAYAIDYKLRRSVGVARRMLVVRAGDDTWRDKVTAILRDHCGGRIVGMQPVGGKHE